MAFSHRVRSGDKSRESEGVIKVRVAEELLGTEIDQLAELLVSVVEVGASVGFIPPLDPEIARAYWRKVISPDHVLLVAERDGRILGTGQLELAMRANGRHRAEVCKVLVHPDAQGQGVGLAIMRALEAEARRLGRTTLHLDTREDDPANRLYQRAGYTRLGTIPNWARNSDGSLAGTTFYYKLLDLDG
jgi:ribosomal protein S18 acetylase RimI-like enzyme